MRIIAILFLAGLAQARPVVSAAQVLKASNHNVLTQSLDAARFYGGLVGKITQTYDQDGNLLTKFITRNGFSCEMIALNNLECVNEITGEDHHSHVVGFFPELK